MSLTPRDRIRRVLTGEPPDRPPVDLWHTAEVGAALRAHTKTGSDLEMYRALGLDKIYWSFVDYRRPDGGRADSQVGASSAAAGSHAGVDESDVPARTTWGVPLRGIEAGAAHYDEFSDAPMRDCEDPAAVDDYPYWPDPDSFAYDEALEDAQRASAHFAVMGPWVSFYEIYCQLRGLEQALMDLVLAPALVEAILDRVEAIQTEVMKRHLERSAAYLDLVFVSDDMGTQTGLLMSPKIWAQHFRARMRRWCDLIHSYGLKVFYHTDGAAEPLIRPLIECGIDVLNPIQHVCPGMDPARLAREYGKDVVFHGGVDNQRVLPFGTPEEVRAEVRMLGDTLGRGTKGFICCSCHNVQAGTPVPNILAMIEAAKEG